MKKKIQGTLKRPRLYIFKSNKHIYAQVIDDLHNIIIASSSTISSNTKTYANCQNAKKVGQTIALELKKKGINQVIFDRGKNIYHGKIEALASAARDEGLDF